MTNQLTAGPNTSMKNRPTSKRSFKNGKLRSQDETQRFHWHSRKTVDLKTTSKKNILQLSGDLMLLVRKIDGIEAPLVQRKSEITKHKLCSFLSSKKEQNGKNNL